MNGLLLIDKPKGYTSRDVVNTVGSLLNTKKVGHGGTLDPIATGVLVIGVGTGLKILEFVSHDDKEYIAKVKFGIETDTLDITGKVTKKVDNYFVDFTKLQNVINSFVGKYEQVVPLYSSVKVGGERLYKYARENIPVELPKREVEIYNIDLLDYNHDGFTFKAKVSKGTYIRSLIRDIGEKLGIFCTMVELRRTSQGNFNIEDTITIEELENGNFKTISLEKALCDIPFITVDSFIEKKVKNGAILENRYDSQIIGIKNKKDEVIALYKVYEKDKNKIKPIKVFK